jgi:hypothetical protein
MYELVISQHLVVERCADVRRHMVVQVRKWMWTLRDAMK